MIKASKRFKKEYPNTANTLLLNFKAFGKRKLNALIRSKPKLLQYIESLVDAPYSSLSSSDVFTLLSGETAPVCLKVGCSSVTGFNSLSVSFKEFCSKKCYNSSPENKLRREATLKKRYGVANPFEAKEIQAKIAATNIERYGVANPSGTPRVIKKRKATSMARYGVEHHMKCEEGRAAQIKSLIANYGVDNPAKSEEVIARTKKTNLKRYGGTNPMHCESVKRKVRKSCLVKYGVDNPRKAESVMRKIRETWITNLGVDHPMRCPEIAAKQMASWRKAVKDKYGVDHTWKVPSIRDKSKKTMLERYGHEFTMQCPELVAKFRSSFVKSCMLKYGVSHPMLDPKVAARVNRESFVSEVVAFGRDILNLQGYEEFVLLHLNKRFNFQRVTSDPRKIGVIKYRHNGRDRLFMPDLKLKTGSGNIMVVEVKSWFTLGKSNGVRFKEATKFYNKRGIDFYLAIGEPKSNSVKLIKNPKDDLSHLIETAKLLSGQ